MISEIKNFRIKKKIFKSFGRTLTIAEIGSNHNQNINLAGEELTPNEMVDVLKKSSGKSSSEVNYYMIPRLFMKIFVNDIGIMADWIERAGYGANLAELKMIAKEENIKMTSLENWLRESFI